MECVRGRVWMAVTMEVSGGKCTLLGLRETLTTLAIPFETSLPQRSNLLFFSLAWWRKNIFAILMSMASMSSGWYFLGRFLLGVYFYQDN